jgi:isopentenyldiphosphate isomerase
LLDESGAPTGVSESRSVVHARGLWHRSTHIWLVHARTRSVLLQRRSQGKDTFPGRWDVAAAGHISAGENSKGTASRELQEELGVGAEDERLLTFWFTARAVAEGETLRHGRFLDREFQDVYLYEGGNVSVDEVVLQEEEVESVQYWDVDEYERALERKDDAFVPRSFEYSAELFPRLRKHFEESNR